ncbi:glycosyltransferase family 2 protein [Anaerosporobacter sp.]
MGIKISVIIPAYNVAGYLEKCLDSVLAQDFIDYEVILIDDGSTDDTPKIADTYAKKDKRIQVIHKTNAGVSIARNTGIELAQGEYILFFDGDDFSESYCLRELYETAVDKKVDTVIYGYYRYENQAIKETCYPIFKNEFYSGEEILENLATRFIGVSQNNVNAWLRNEEDALYVENPALWRMMVSTKLIKENKIRFNSNLKVGEDTIFTTEYLSYATKCYVLQKCYYYLVTRETSTIFTYEKNPLAKLEGKVKLLDARNEVTSNIKKRTSFDIETYWRGTVIMSCMEIAFLMARRNPNVGFFKRYKMFLSYIKITDVQKIIKEFKLEFKGGIKLIPFLMLKTRLYFLLFLSVSFLNAIHYEFKR